MEATNVNNRGFTEKNAKIKKGLCIFPFKYKGKKHTTCLTTPRGDICATTLSKHGTLKNIRILHAQKKHCKKNTQEEEEIKIETN